MIGESPAFPELVQAPAKPAEGAVEPVPQREIGGRGGPDPVRYGDWEKNGRCIDF